MIERWFEEGVNLHRLEDMLAALQQIEDKRYASELKAVGVKDILQLAVAFQGKELWLKEHKERQ